MQLYGPALPTSSTLSRINDEATCEETSFRQTSSESCPTESTSLGTVTMESFVVVDGPLEEVLEESEEVTRVNGAQRAKQVSFQMKLASEDR